MGYLRNISNYSKRITLSNSFHIKSMTNHVSISVKILRIDSERSLEKEFTELIRMNN